MITLSTTGILTSVIINDLGGRVFDHPVVDYDLSNEYTIEEIRDSEDLANALDSNYIVLKQNTDLIPNSTELKILEAANEEGGVSGDDKYFKINALDATADYHENKIVDSDSILWETIDNLGVKTRRPFINPNYDFDFNGTITINGAIEFGAAVTIDVNSNTNNLLIPNLGSSLLIRLNFTGNYSLTGIVPNDATKGQWIIVINVGLGQGSIKDNDAGSLAQNRFLLGANKTIQTNEGIALVYDTVDTRWRSFAINI